LRETSNDSIFLRHEGCGVRKYSPMEAREAQIRLVYIAKSLEGFLSRKETCLIRCDSMEDNGYEIVRVFPEDSLWNPETQTLQMTSHMTPRATILHKRKSKTWAAFIFYNSENDLGFVIILSLTERNSPRHIMISSVKILDKPEGVALERLLQDLQSKGYQFSAGDQSSAQVHPKKIRGLQVKVSTKVTKQEILNQNVFIVEVKMGLIVDG
jgi:hypothetical protein